MDIEFTVKGSAVVNDKDLTATGKDIKKELERLLYRYVGINIDLKITDIEISERFRYGRQ